MKIEMDEREFTRTSGRSVSYGRKNFCRLSTLWFEEFEEFEEFRSAGRLCSSPITRSTRSTLAYFELVEKLRVGLSARSTLAQGRPFDALNACSGQAFHFSPVTVHPSFLCAFASLREFLGLWLRLFRKF